MHESPLGAGDGRTAAQGDSGGKRTLQVGIVWLGVSGSIPRTIRHGRAYCREWPCYDFFFAASSAACARWDTGDSGIEFLRKCSRQRQRGREAFQSQKVVISNRRERWIRSAVSGDGVHKDDQKASDVWSDTAIMDEEVVA